jgi:hypothetical protein
MNVNMSEVISFKTPTPNINKMTAITSVTISIIIHNNNFVMIATHNANQCLTNQ